MGDSRLNRQMIASEYRVLPTGSWVRERLNRWHDERVDAPFSLKAWGACRLPDALNPGALLTPIKYTIGVDVTSTWSEGSIIIAAQRADGRVGIEVHRHLVSRPSVPLQAEDFTDEVQRLALKLKVEQVVYAASSPLAPMMERLAITRSINCVPITPARNMMACNDFAEAVTSERIAHDDPHLDQQIGIAQRRFIGSDGSWRWTISLQPITSVVAMTFASMYAMQAVAPVQVFV
jgi:hypothetical protein